MLVSLTTAVQYVEKSILQHTHVSHQYTQRDDGRAHSKIELIIVARPILVAHLSYHIRETFCVIKHDGVSLLLICVNVLRTWVARFKRSSCSLCTTCHTISWFIYLLFAYDVCVWRINLIDWLINWLIDWLIDDASRPVLAVAPHITYISCQFIHNILVTVAQARNQTYRKGVLIPLPLSSLPSSSSLPFPSHSLPFFPLPSL